MKQKFEENLAYLQAALKVRGLWRLAAVTEANVLVKAKSKDRVWSDQMGIYANQEIIWRVYAPKNQVLPAQEHWNAMHLGWVHA